MAPPRYARLLPRCGLLLWACLTFMRCVACAGWALAPAAVAAKRARTASMERPRCVVRRIGRFLPPGWLPRAGCRGWRVVIAWRLLSVNRVEVEGLPFLGCERRGADGAAAGAGRRGRPPFQPRGVAVHADLGARAGGVRLTAWRAGAHADVDLDHLQDADPVRVRGRR